MKAGGGRLKGAAFERATAELCRSYGWKDARRGFQFRSGSEVPDIIAGPEGFWLECEHARAPDPWRKLAQAYEAQGYKPFTGHDYTPVAIVKRNGKPALACMHVEDFLRLVREHFDMKTALALAPVLREGLGKEEAQGPAMDANEVWPGEVPCRACGAKPGQLCTEDGRRLLVGHHSRVDDAEKATAAKAEVANG